MKKNMFLSICSLIMTTLLLFFLVYGWYVSNTEVSATGILGSTKDEDYEASLEYAVLNDSGEVVLWESCESISYTNLEPGSVMLFRLALKSKLDKAITLTVTFNEILSTLAQNKLQIKGSSLYEIKTDIPIYNIVNGEVLVKDSTDGDLVEKVLYRVLNDNIELADYKIEDCFKVYNLGQEAPVDNTIPSNNEGLLLKDGKGFSVTAQVNLDYHYFSLEFNEELSNRNVNGFISSNMYLYQNLKIGRISIIS